MQPHLFMYILFFLFLAALGLPCYTWAFSSCDSRGYSSLRCASFSWWWLLFWGVWALGAQASVEVVHRLTCSGVCGIFLDWDWTRASGAGRWILYHWATREALIYIFLAAVFELHQPSLVAWPANLKIVTTWPFTEKPCQLLGILPRAHRAPAGARSNV